MRENNKYRTLVSRVSLKTHSAEQPQRQPCEAGVRRAVMIPEQPSKADSGSPDVECLQSYSTESVFLANAVQGNTVRFACIVHILILHLL